MLTGCFVALVPRADTERFSSRMSSVMPVVPEGLAPTGSVSQIKKDRSPESHVVQSVAKTFPVFGRQCVT